MPGSTPRSGPLLSGRRSSTTQSPSSRAVDQCSGTTTPSARRAGSRPGSVPEVLTTTRSPGSSSSGRSRNATVAVPSGRTAMSRTSSRWRPVPLRRCRGLGVGGERERRRHRVAPADSRSAARYRPLGRSPSISASRRRDDGLRRRPVADVLAREGGLVHVGRHVAGVDRVDPQLRVLDGEDGGELVEGGLARAVAAPARVGLDGGVRADVHDPAAGAAEGREDGLDERERRDGVDGEDAQELVGRQVGELRQRARAEVAGVVDEQVEPRADRLGQGRAVPRVGDVPGDGGDEVGAGECGDGRRPAGAASRPSTTSRQPRSERAVASARPRPREAPVTSAVRVVMGLPSDLKWT